MTTPFEIPFYASHLPCPLPTNAEIENALDITLAYDGRRVVGVGQHFVVKFGVYVNLMEGENMLFVRENTNIPVPRVFALYSHPSTGKNYIVMERIIGQSLLSAWPQITTSDKERALSELRRYFDELRHLPSPGYFGSFGSRPLLDDIFWTKDPDPLVNGPFNSEKDLNEAMIRKYIYNNNPPIRAEYLRKCLPFVFKDHEAVFTHGDLQRKNIMIREKDNQSNEAASLVIIDWEKSGWYPQYWEYCLAVCALRFDDDWPLCIDSFLTPFISESAWIQSLRLELWS
ncbi:phosphotransferase enzyme family protein [Penicillium chermesinum]|uniref:Phosphotransferase enzyme family protein n=1 Tax=Penicillium chermesinum TaxID=63820 RepID=A0A9W9NPF9_9EURO|nr:phosphotransferase enzyme family protein [Penicillium chermesinum]KAJ5223571.1 phosphotransferase enzyme family protein [Penicillium chermesinum]KAJ6155600.1 phosphotransferase enzyme family protein [Penicillium chermesinum]